MHNGIGAELPLYEDEIRSVEGRGARRGGPEGGGNGAPEREKRKRPPAYLTVAITDTVAEKWFAT